jgi:hypothetical protein
MGVIKVERRGRKRSGGLKCLVECEGYFLLLFLKDLLSPYINTELDYVLLITKI